MALAELVRVLGAARGPVTTAELAERLAAEPAVVGGMLDWLARSGRATAACDPGACGVACSGCAFARLRSGRRPPLLSRSTLR